MRHLLHHIIIAGILIASAGALCAQSMPSRHIADSLFNAMEWKDAAAAYQDYLRKDATNGAGWMRLGYALHAVGNYERAIEAYERSLKFATFPITMYNLACSNARIGRSEKALEWLAMAARNGFGQVAKLEGDSDLAPLHNDHRYGEALEEVKRNANPCSLRAEFKQFDFWLGDWDVFDPQGNLVGTNTIHRFVGDCALQENWQGTGGTSGKSINYYDIATAKWYQTWIDQSGHVTTYSGLLKSDGVMYFEAHTHGQGGAALDYRMTFTRLPQGNVRQLWEQSGDGGRNWATVFDGTYVPKKGKS